MENTLEQFSADHWNWVKANFGEHPSWQPLIGMGEEVGELDSALIGGDESDVIDSIADIMIYMNDFCHVEGLNYPDIVRKGMELKSDTGMSAALGLVCHHYLKRYQGIRGSYEEHTKAIETNLIELVSVLVYMLDETFEGMDLPTVIFNTWNSIVSKRNWVSK